MNEQTNPETGPDEQTGTPGTDPDVVDQSDNGGQPAHESVSVPSGSHPGEQPAFESVSVPDVTTVKRVLEAALLSSSEPLTVQQLRRLFAGEVAADNIRKVLDDLKDEWAERSIELTAVASGWRFRVKPDYQKFLDRISNEKPPRYSRAVLETLAIIAYRQPVTRGDIEEIRGVAVSPPTLKALEERGWVEVIGQRETPGRPAIFATTKRFLDDLNLRSLEELPPLEELQASLAAAPAALVDDAPSPAPEQQALLDESHPDETQPEESTERETHAG